MKWSLPGEPVDDGHRVVAHVDNDILHLRFTCPGEGCRADKMACYECMGEGRENWEPHCESCGGTGCEEMPEGFCWLRDESPNWDGLEVYYVGEGVDLDADNRIAWKNHPELGLEWALRGEPRT